MPQENERWNFARWINGKLQEDHGHMFKNNKWKFWLPTQAGLQALNTGLTWYLFPGNVGAFIGCAGALLVWLCICFLHYTDSGHKDVDQGVSRLDSASLGFMALHFCFLVWVAGHSALLRDAEQKYETQRTEYNNRIEKDRERRLEQTKVEADREKARERAARLEEGAAYWAAKRGTPVKRTQSRTQSPSLTSEGGEEKLESFEKPDKPAGVASDYLTSMDIWVRLAGFGEFVFSIWTLIFIRNKSAKANHDLNTQADSLRYVPGRSGSGSARVESPAPSAAFRSDRLGGGTRDSASLPDDAGSLRSEPIPRGIEPAPSRDDSDSSRSDSGSLRSPDDSQVTRDAMALLRDHLRQIRPPGHFFKADKKPTHVLIRLCRSVGQVDEHVAITKQPLSILDAVINRPARFREVLVTVLKREGFPV